MLELAPEPKLFESGEPEQKQKVSAPQHWIWYPYMKLILLIYTAIQSFMTYVWFNGLLKGKTANFLTKQSDL